MDYIPFVKLKVTSDALLYKLRERDDIEDHPITLAIPLNYMNSPQHVKFDQVSRKG